MTDDTRPTPDAHRIAAETALDARTVQRYLDGAPVRAATERMIAVAARKLRLTLPVRGEVDGAVPATKRDA